MMECVINGGELNAELMYEEMDRMGVKHVRVVSAYNPKANLEERPHQQFVSAIAKACQGNTAIRETKVASAFWAERVSINKVTGMSPYKFVFGQRAVFRVEFSLETFDVIGWRFPMKREDLLAARIRQLERRPGDIEQAREKIMKARAVGKERWDSNRQIQKVWLEVGELVLVLDGTMMGTLKKKYEQRWYGPYRINKVLEGGTYLLEELDGTTYKKPIHGDRLALYLMPLGQEENDQVTKPLPATFDQVTDDQEAEVSRIQTNESTNQEANLTLFTDDDPSQNYFVTWCTKIALYHNFEDHKMRELGASYGLTEEGWMEKVREIREKRSAKGRRSGSVGVTVRENTGAMGKTSGERRSKRILVNAGDHFKVKLGEAVIFDFLNMVLCCHLPIVT
jgi:hypothetical protein